MCMELLTAAMVCVYKYQGLFNDTPFNGSSFDTVFDLEKRTESPAFVEFFKDKFELLDFGRGHTVPGNQPASVLPKEPSLYASIIYTWCWMHKGKEKVYLHNPNDVYTPISNNHKDLLRFAEMISLM